MTSAPPEADSLGAPPGTARPRGTLTGWLDLRAARWASSVAALVAILALGVVMSDAADRLGAEATFTFVAVANAVPATTAVALVALLHARGTLSDARGIGPGVLFAALVLLVLSTGLLTGLSMAAVADVPRSRSLFDISLVLSTVAVQVSRIGMMLLIEGVLKRTRMPVWLRLLLSLAGFLIGPFLVGPFLVASPFPPVPVGAVGGVLACTVAAFAWATRTGSAEATAEPTAPSMAG